MGGKDINTPLNMAISMGEMIAEDEPNLKQRVFLMTDGKVDNSEEVIEQCENPAIVVHTVGIGLDVDTKLLTQAAEKGRGSCNIITDRDDQAIIDSKIIQSLLQAQAPALDHCHLIWESNGKVI